MILFNLFIKIDFDVALDIDWNKFVVVHKMNLSIVDNFDFHGNDKIRVISMMNPMVKTKI